MNDDASRISSTEVSEDFLSAGWRRIKQHRVAQWTIGYFALAYGIQHAVTLTSEAYEWPNIVARVSMTILALGVPIAMTVAWYHGERASRRMSTGEFSIVSLLLVIASLLFYVFIRPFGEFPAAIASGAQEASVTAARTAAASPKGAISVAVLPFLNLSSDKEQEFFSDGMTEEITTALAKVPDLRVVGRTSAFQFKGANKDLRAIGQALSATHLIEGSVRKAGNRLRITAQLIKADDGTHVWAEDYDRELTDVFAIQEDIARAITASLHMTLGLKPGENLVNNRTIDPNTYTDYLRIRAGVTAVATDAARQQARGELERILAQHPDFAPAWAYLARLPQSNNTWWRMWLQPLEKTREEQADIVRQMEHDAREAIRLDPGQAYAYSALAAVEINRGHWAGAAALIKSALARDPNNPDMILDSAAFSIRTGHLQDTLRLTQEAQALDPLSPNHRLWYGMALLAENQPQAAITFLEARPDRRIVGITYLAEAYAATGQFEKAADWIAASKRGAFYSVDPKSVDAAEALMRALAAKMPVPKVYPVAYYNWAFAYAGHPERLMDEPERLWQIGNLQRAFIFDHSLAPVRKTERFKKFLRDVGLVDYWRATGWPDLCHPTTGDDFECS